MNIQSVARAIPADLKRKVRQRCAFGCVVCGASIYEYDHFDPPFAETTAHVADGITLLCPTHHGQKTRGILPLELLREFNAKPMAHRSGESKVSLPYFKGVPRLLLGGGLAITNTPVPITVCGVPLIEFKPPEEGSDITQICAEITSDDGTALLTISDNEWAVESGIWDYEWVGARMTIRDAKGSIALQLVIHPPHQIEVDRLRFNRNGFDVTITRTEVNLNGSTYVDCIASGCGVGLALGGPIAAISR